MEALRVEHGGCVIGRPGTGRRPTRLHRALTIVECIVALTILPLAVAGVTMAIVAGQSQAVSALRSVHVATLGEDLMEEILSKPYADPDGASVPGPEAGELRASFDNADDYDDFTQPSGSLSGPAGVAYSEAFQRYSRDASCKLTTVNVPALGVVRNALAVTVTVRDAGEPVLTLTRLILEPK